MGATSQRVVYRYLEKQAVYRVPEAWVRIDKDAVFMSVEIPVPPMDWAEKIPVYTKEALDICREGAEGLQRVFGGESKSSQRLFYIAKEGGKFALLTEAPVSVGVFGVALPSYKERTPEGMSKLIRQVHSALPGWKIQDVDIVR